MMYVGRLLTKLLIRETYIFNIDTFPGYDELIDLPVRVVFTSVGVYELRVKRDVSGRWGLGRFLPSRSFTVELVYIGEEDKRNDIYHNKLMLAVKLNIPVIPIQFLTTELINVYLGHILKEDLKIDTYDKHIENRRDE